MRKAWIALTFAGLSAGTLAAQDASPYKLELVAKAQPTRYMEPECELKGGYFLVNSGISYLKTGTQTSVEGNKIRIFNDAIRVLNQAIAERDQADNPAAWYYLGRSYLMLGDVPGADTAFTRAEQLAPECRTDITAYRRRAWVPLLNAGIVAIKEDRSADALRLLTQANDIYRAEPNAVANIGVLYASTQPDSAIKYFRQSVDIASRDTSMRETRNQSAFNLAVLLSNSGRTAEALVAWKQYVDWNPDDMDGRRALASAFRQAEMPDSALAIEQALVAAGGEDVGANDLMSLGVNLFREKEYAKAAATFGQLVEREPFNRDAVYNMANAYLGAEDGANLIKAGRLLVAIDPLNENALQLLGQGYRMTKAQDSTVAVFTRFEALPVNVEITAFRSSAAGGPLLSGTVTGRAAKTVSGRPIKAVPVTLVFEFLDAESNVVATEEVPIAALEAGATHALDLKPAADGVMFWRYHRKP